MKRLLSFFVFFLTGISSLAQVNLSDGLIGCYNFNGNSNDASGLGNDGVVSGAILASDRAGAADRAYEFFSTSAIKIPAAKIAEMADYTWSLWAYIVNAPSGGEAQALFSVGPPAANQHVSLSLTNSYSSAGFLGWTTGGYTQEGTFPSVTTTSFPNSRQWYHLTCTRNENALKLYVNGDLIGTSVSPDTPWFYLKDDIVALIGLRSNGQQGFNGVIDEVGIWDRALTTGEVVYLYQNGLPCADIKIQPPIASGASFCGPVSVTLTASNGTDFIWYDSLTAGNEVFHGNPFITPLLKKTTSYFVASAQGAQQSIRTKVTVDILPNPILECLVPNEAKVDEEIQIGSNVSGGTPPYSFTFDFGDQTGATTTFQHLSHRYSNEGRFEIRIHVADLNGCHADCSATIIENFEFFVPNVITPNDDHFNRALTLFIDVGDHYVPYPGAEPFFLEVYNRWGEEVFRSFDASKGWSGSSNSAGTYYYNLALSDKKFKGWVQLIR